jgi:hypothetical protein
MTSLEILYTKDIAGELSFLLVTHMTRFDIRFGFYGFFNSGYGAELILDRLIRNGILRFRGLRLVRPARV